MAGIRAAAQSLTVDAAARERSDPRRAATRPAGTDDPAKRRLDPGQRAKPRPHAGPGTVEELAHGAVARAQPRLDLGVASALELTHHQRLTLTFREGADSLDHQAKVFTALERIRVGRELGNRLGPSDRSGLARSQQVQRCVVGDGP